MKSFVLKGTITEVINQIKEMQEEQNDSNK